MVIMLGLMLQRLLSFMLPLAAAMAHAQLPPVPPPAPSSSSVKHADSQHLNIGIRDPQGISTALTNLTTLHCPHGHAQLHSQRALLLTTTKDHGAIPKVQYSNCNSSSSSNCTSMKLAAARPEASRRRRRRRRVYRLPRRSRAGHQRVLVGSGARWGGESLSHTFYDDKCPKLEFIVQTKLMEWLDKDFTLAASLLRLHSQDCLVTGCDASILLRDPISQSTEMYSVHNKGLRGFHVVDDIKLAIEKECPGIVSCADILALIARDAVLQMGGPFWFVLLGRQDSLSSRKEDVAKQLPRPDSDANTLIKKFEEMGLSFADLAALLGAHSVGMSHCFSLRNPNYTNPKLNTSYMQHLRLQCSISSTSNGHGRWVKERPLARVPNDPVTPFLMDVTYYENLKSNMGLFRSDQSLYIKGKEGNKMTNAMVNAFVNQPGFWETQFAVSMVNLGSVGVLAAGSQLQGEIRHVCSTRNPPTHPCRHGASCHH